MGPLDLTSKFLLTPFAGCRGVVHLERRLVLLRLRRWQEVRGAATDATVAVVRVDHFGDRVDAVGGEKGSSNFKKPPAAPFPSSSL